MHQQSSTLSIERGTLTVEIIVAVILRIAFSLRFENRKKYKL